MEHFALALHGRAAAPLHQLQGGQGRCERIAQLVAEHGEELVLAPARLLRDLGALALAAQRFVLAV